MEQTIKEIKKSYHKITDKKTSIYLMYDRRTVFFEFLFSAFMTIEDDYNDLEVYF